MLTYFFVEIVANFPQSTNVLAASTSCARVVYFIGHFLLPYDI